MNANAGIVVGVMALGVLVLIWFFGGLRDKR